MSPRRLETVWTLLCRELQEEAGDRQLGGAGTGELGARERGPTWLEGTGSPGGYSRSVSAVGTWKSNVPTPWPPTAPPACHQVGRQESPQEGELAGPVSQAGSGSRWAGHGARAGAGHWGHWGQDGPEHSLTHRGAEKQAWPDQRQMWVGGVLCGLARLPGLEVTVEGPGLTGEGFGRSGEGCWGALTGEGYGWELRLWGRSGWTGEPRGLQGRR